MQTYKRAIFLAAAMSMAVGAPLLSAAPDDTTQTKALPTGDVEAGLTPRQMQVKSEEHVNDMQAVLRRVVELQQVARKQKDVIKLNCVNDKLLQVKQLMNIADTARTDMVEATVQDDGPDIAHQFSQVTIAKDKTNVLRAEAEGCIGDELVFLGPTEVTVDEGDVIDDPTDDDEFANDDVIDPPGYASPFS